MTYLGNRLTLDLEAHDNSDLNNIFKRFLKHILLMSFLSIFTYIRPKWAVGLFRNWFCAFCEEVKLLCTNV